MTQENFPIRQSYLSYFPTIFSSQIAEWVNQFEKLFKQPIKGVFPYPMDVIKVYDDQTKKLKSLVFKVALAGLTKDDIKVQLKNKKFLTITVDQKTDQMYEGIQEYVSKGISYRNCEITFRIIPEIDLSDFKPTFINGLLKIKLNIKESSKESDDVIVAEL